MWHHPHLFSTLWRRGMGRFSSLKCSNNFDLGCWWLIQYTVLYGPRYTSTNIARARNPEIIYRGAELISGDDTPNIWYRAIISECGAIFLVWKRGYNSPGVSPRSKCFRAVLSSKKADFRILVAREIRSFALPNGTTRKRLIRRLGQKRQRHRILNRLNNFVHSLTKYHILNIRRWSHAWKLALKAPPHTEGTCLHQLSRVKLC